MNQDATLGTHPIIQEVSNPDQITEIFDAITYSKGASIIRMLENSIGEESFQRAVNAYLNEYQYKNAVTSDFLAKIEAEKPNFNVVEMMRTWTEQSGLPVVNVHKVNETHLLLTQKRFLSNPKDYTERHVRTDFESVQFTMLILHFSQYSSELN